MDVQPQLDLTSHTGAPASYQVVPKWPKLLEKSHKAPPLPQPDIGTAFSTMEIPQGDVSADVEPATAELGAGTVEMVATGRLENVAQTVSSQ